ncbi:MAG: GNAT family N-acetyltransferase [Magnetococcus sp. DMHC-6]
MEILNYFAAYFPKYVIFVQHFSPKLQNWLPFYWAGFKQTTRITYNLYNLPDTQKIWDGMRSNIRGDIRKAQKQGIVVQSCTPEIALSMFAKTRSRQDRKAAYTDDFFINLYKSCKTRQAGECFAAFDPQGNPHAAAFLVWDKKKAYYLVGGGDSELRNSGATSLLIWNMIEFAAQRSDIFDFEGSVIKPVERFFRAFGAQQVPYHVVRKFPMLVRIVLAVMNKI